MSNQALDSRLSRSKAFHNDSYYGMDLYSDHEVLKASVVPVWGATRRLSDPNARQEVMMSAALAFIFEELLQFEILIKCYLNF